MTRDEVTGMVQRWLTIHGHEKSSPSGLVDLAVYVVSEAEPLIRDDQRGFDIRQQVEERDAFRERVSAGLADWGWENRDIEAVLSLFVRGSDE